MTTAAVEGEREPRPKPTEKRVAVIGAGPAGLTAAYYLRLAGPRRDRLRDAARGRRDAALRHTGVPAAARGARR